MDDDTRHPLGEVLISAAAGRFPPIDGVVEVFGPDPAGTCAVVELTGHSYVLTERPPDDVMALGVHGYGGCTHPDVLRWLAGPTGEIGSLDAVLVTRGRAAADHVAAQGLTVLDHLDDHPRVVRARHHRRDVQVLGDERGVVTLGRGLAGRWELSVELTGAAAGSGAGRALIEAGLAVAGPQRLVWAQVAPGNAASLRAFLAAGFVPVGGEVLISPAPRDA